MSSKEKLGASWSFEINFIGLVFVFKIRFIASITFHFIFLFSNRNICLLIYFIVWISLNPYYDYLFDWGLPEAHVEAPIARSVISAGIPLKLGSNVEVM